MIDRQGQPVAGALVFQSGDGPMRTETSSDDQGRFRLAGVLEGPAVVFAQKGGFRLQFHPIDDGAIPIRVTLARTSEPPAATFRTSAPALPAGEEETLSRRLIQPYAERVVAEGE